MKSESREAFSCCSREDQLLTACYTLSPQGRNKYVCVSHSVISNSLRPHGLEPSRLFCLWDSPGKNTGVGCHVLLQGIFPTQGSNPGLLYCRRILYHLSHQGSIHALHANISNPHTFEKWVLLPLPSRSEILGSGRQNEFLKAMQFINSRVQNQS